MKTILFVCTGNTCRSPMAVGLVKKALGKRRNIKIKSAGVIAPNGLHASGNAIGVMEELDVDISRHRTQPLTKALIAEADLVFVMTQIHKLEVINLLERPGKEVYLIREFDPKAHQGNLDVPDPIGKPISIYRHCRDEIKRCVPDLVKKILKK